MNWIKGGKRATMQTIKNDGKEILMMEKDELLDKIQDCMDDASAFPMFENGGLVAAYSEENDQLYDPGELAERLGDELGRELDKIVLLKDGKVALYVCENELVVKKFRDKVRQEVQNNREYNEVLKQAALELNISVREADELLAGSAATIFACTVDKETDTAEETLD